MGFLPSFRTLIVRNSVFVACFDAGVCFLPASGMELMLVLLLFFRNIRDDVCDEL